MTPYQKWIAFHTIYIKEVRRFMRIWVQTIVPPAITIVLYFIIFGEIIGTRIGPMEGYNYTQFVAPGLVMLAVINSAYANVVSSFFGAKFQRSLEELLISPTPNYIILHGYVLGGVTRSILVGGVAAVIALFFTDLSIQYWGIMIVVLLLTATLFALLGFINAVYARTFDDVTVIPTFVITPLIYLGGIFYSINLLPELWQKISLLNPILYMVNTFRYGTLGISDINVLWALTMIGVFICITYIYALHLLRTSKKLRQ